MTLFEARMSPNVTSQWREGTDTQLDNDADDDDHASYLSKLEVSCKM